MVSVSGKKILFKIVSLLLVSMMSLTALSCSEKAASEGNAEGTAPQTETQPEDTRDTRFDGVDFGGREFRVFTSINTNDATNANALIEGSGTLNGETVNDAVYTRNHAVEDLLNVKMIFTESNYDYGAVASNIRKLVMSADDAYDLIINDLFPAGELTYEGMFVNIDNTENFDFTKSYWYNGYMEDLKLTNDRMYIMAGDYFMDIIGSCHAIFYNKNMLTDIFGAPDLIYDHVLDNSWTMDKFITYINSAYMDINGDSKQNEGDQFGYAAIGTWGSAFPFVIASDTKFIQRNEDYSISFIFNNERSVQLLEKMVELFYGQGTIFTIKNQTAEGLRALFAAKQALFVGYQRLGNLEQMRTIDFEIGIVPYPKFDDAQKNYVTSSHDTTEIGTIPITATDINFITTVIEVLNRESATTVIPAYYETALKVKYTRDDVSAQMIDIIHDNFGVTFPLAYGSSLNNFLLGQSFCDLLTKKSTDFASAYAKNEAPAIAKLEKMVSTLVEKTSG